MAKCSPAAAGGCIRCFTVEDHALENGFGTAVLEHAAAERLPTATINRLGMPDRMIAHATRKETACGDRPRPAGIAQSVREWNYFARRDIAVEVSQSI